jgi:methyl-accepting chemotaxis protein
MKNWLPKRSLLTNLLTGSFAIIFFVCASGYTATAYFLGQNDLASTVRSTTDRIDIQFLQARNAEKDFLLTDLTNGSFYERGESEHLALREVQMGLVSKELETLSVFAGDRGQVLIASLRTSVKAYNESVRALAAAYREKGYKDWGVQGDWRKSIHDAEAVFKTAKYGPLEEVLLLQLRRDEKDYLLRGESQYVDAVRADLKQLTTRLQSSPGPQLGQLLEDLNLYDQLFSKYLAIEDRIGKSESAGLQADAKRLAGQVESLLDEMSKQALLDGQSTRRRLTFGGATVLITGMGLAALFLYVLARSIVRPINSSVIEIASTAKEQQATASEIAATTAEIGATSLEISATSKQLVATMNEVAMVAEQSAALAGQGQNGLTHMEETMRRVTDAAASINAKLAVLSDKAGNISQVVTTITKVADQTNLLSLNAAIEAEKAGEYGRGFAVVATEIRRLADQTAVSTYDIEQIVKEIQSAVAAGVMGMDKFSEEVRRGMEDVQQIGGQLSQVIQQVQALAPRIDSVNEGMQAQSSGAEQITQALGQLSEAARQTVDSLRQSGLAIDELNRVATGVPSGVSRLTLHAA